jgi:hypothetical protein
MAEGDDSFALNTLITILIATAIIISPPLVSYIGSRLLLHYDDETLIKKYRDEKDITKFNTFNEIYLFCSYIPYKNMKGCVDKSGTEAYARYIMDASKIIERLNDINKELDAKSKELEEIAETRRNESRRDREKREQEEKITREKDANANYRHDIDTRFKYINMIVNLVSSGFRHFITNMLKLSSLAMKFGEIIVKTFGPIAKALAANKVVMGFIILVFCIYLILGLLKKDTETKNKQKIGGVPALSGFSLSYIYDDIMDTYNHYKNMANSFSMSDYTGELFKTEDDKGMEDEDEDDDTIISRKKLEGGQYDNRSYINIREIFGSNAAANAAIEEYFGKGTIEDGKYYNIYLPDEKFKNSHVNVKWKHAESKNMNKGDRVWVLDCEQLDGIKNADDTVLENAPAFIASKDKCVINKSKLDAFHKPPASGEEKGYGDVVFATEYIR